jgi:hypothetical protein
MRDGHDCLRVGGGTLFTYGECLNQKDQVFFQNGEKRFRAVRQELPAARPRFPHKPPANDPPRRKPIKQRTEAPPEPFTAPVDLSNVLLWLDQAFQT